MNGMNMEELQRMVVILILVSFAYFQEQMFSKFVALFCDFLCFLAIIIFISRIRDACFQKCIHRFSESNISPGEGACIDRFVAFRNKCVLI